MMNKRTAVLILSAILILLSACGGKDSGRPEIADSEAVRQPEISSPAPSSESLPPASDSGFASEPEAPEFTSDASQYRGGTAECIVKYYDPTGRLYLVEDIIYSSPAAVFSDSYTDPDGKPCAPPEPGLYPPQSEADGDCEVHEDGSDKTVTWRSDKGMKSDVVKYDEGGNPLKWTYFDDSGNISGWITYTYRFADGSETTGGDM